MRKLILMFFIFVCFDAAAQPSNYTWYKQRTRQYSLMADSALYLPRYNGTPSGVRSLESSTISGMVGIDTTNHMQYFRSGGLWRRLANYTELGVDSIWRVPGTDSIFWSKQGTTYKIKDSAGVSTNIYNSDGTLSGWRTLTTGNNRLEFYTDANNYLRYDPFDKKYIANLIDSPFETYIEYAAGNGITMYSRDASSNTGQGGLLTAFSTGSNVEFQQGANIIGMENKLSGAADPFINRLVSFWATENPYIGMSIDSAGGSRIGKATTFNQPSTIRGIRVLPNWQIYMDSIDAGGTASDSVLVIQADGKVVRRNASAFGGSSVPLSSLTAATGSNTINNGAHRQEWQWNSLTSGAALTLSSSSVQTGSLLRLIGTQNNPGSADDSGMLYVSSVGITGPGSSTTYGIRSLVDRIGSGAFNVAGYFEAVNGTTNYAAKFTRGRVSFGTVGTESARIEINGGTSGTVTIQPAAAAGTYTLTLPTTDGSSGEFLQTDGSGVLTWAAASGGSSAGNFGNLQINRNGAFATPASDSLDFESATGLTVKGGIRGTTLGVNIAAPTATYAAEIASDGTYGTNLKLSNTGTPTSFLTMNSVYGDVLSWGSLFKGSELLISQSDGIFGISQGANQIARFTASDGMYAGRRWQTKQGADVASAAGAITLGGDGNVFEITGTSAITLISSTNWQNGATVTLLFTSTATLTDGTANSGSNIGMELAGNANFTATADDVLTLVLSEIGGTQRWREVSRTVN
jgi:hypothetical protein